MLDCSAPEPGISRRQFLAAAAAIAMARPSFGATGPRVVQRARCPNVSARDDEQFIAAFLPPKMTQYEVPGAAFAMVKDGGLLAVLDRADNKQPGVSDDRSRR